MKINLSCNIVILLAGFLLYSCNSSSDIKKSSDKKSGQEITNNPYFPAAEGNKWEYINEAPRDESEIYRVEMLSVKSEDKDQIVELNSFPFFSKKEEKTKLRIKENGEIYVINGANEELCIAGKNNLKNGYSWTYGEWNCSAINWNDSVKTEFGTYSNCLFLNYSISITFSAEIWIAKDIGIVKWGYNRTNPPTLRPIYYVLRNLSLSK